jgi:hypothetical protein
VLETSTQTSALPYPSRAVSRNAESPATPAAPARACYLKQGRQPGDGLLGTWGEIGTGSVYGGPLGWRGRRLEAAGSTLCFDVATEIVKDGLPTLSL